MLPGIRHELAGMAAPAATPDLLAAYDRVIIGHDGSHVNWARLM
ncbi:MAG: hypothetical protein Q8T09_01920 [Candidatus Melainabacteria bacterium]|nr:hypothetical protein [Candidatus Melainabacteria bacterium]